MSNTIILIHGMFLNPRSWEPWQHYFNRKGYDCIAPAWPLHSGDPAALRANSPAGLGKLSLQSVMESMREAVAPYDNPILIGHSVGGLIVQKLLSQGIGSLGVPICSVAPNRMMSLDWGMLRNITSIINPLKGDELYPMDADGFFQNFGNTMKRPDSDAAYIKYAMPESRNVLRGCLTDAGEIDLDRKHVPLLFISAEKDEIIPPSLCAKNAQAYTDEGSRADHMEFKNRGHFICGQPQWEEVADYIETWIQAQSAAAALRRQAV